MTAALPDGYVVHLPPPAHRPHQCGPSTVIPAAISVSGCEQHERTCQACGAVKVTIIRANGHHCRAWRKDATARQIETTIEPPCACT
jgi:hypothetical protein